RRRSRVRDQRLEIAPHGAELRGADVEDLSRDVGLARTRNYVDEIVDGEELIPIRAVAEDVDAAALVDPVEEDLEDAEALGPEEGLRPDDDRLERGGLDQPLASDLRLAVRPDADERRVLPERMHLRDAVHSGRRDVHDATYARVACGLE